MRGDLVIGIDSSTTATKAIAFDVRGRIVAEGRAPIPLSNPHPGWFEQEVGDWTGALTKALKQLTKKIDAKQRTMIVRMIRKPNRSLTWR